jgi:hypothetical protein
VAGSKFDYSAVVDMSHYDKGVVAGGHATPTLCPTR